MVDALAVRAEEGRGRAAKRPGELRASGDPGVSEWGNLARWGTASPGDERGERGLVLEFSGGHRGK